ncbi:uncharacterized protein ACLA_022800 [Aspergillus clavatus NRRL 1]|uniref:Uncharacterized protein n=1 Tax=Aspergillus clavatus (strain ATCC 1007 / CBS 513.65 / DSM 816 / NCTC 3887 / NRRL 1 / QM 1276 / 107) TaxID=344612 RepID=A1CPJ5_ASPCL|nr:uncharacterized protein ACLA_022800 [Aspergillus clavatus NRRL 1]EAW07566.1 conserved hypothetical protein [Aspergillus clavatus NRRL 1]
MPSPVAKGLIITVSALVAAGIAVYESPQFREWVQNSRRKIALALHNLGDEIHPRESASPLREDISMTEEVGPAAEERRRIALEEIQRRASVLEARKKRRQSATFGSFDALVDENGNLLRSGSPEASGSALANSTAVELAPTQLVQRGVKQPDVSSSASEAKAADLVSDNDKLHIDIPSPSNRSVALVDLTPTSDATDTDIFASVHNNLEEVDQSAVSSTTEQHSLPSRHTESHSQAPYDHLDSSMTEADCDLRSPFSDFSDLNSTTFEQPGRSATPSTSGSFSHIYESAEDRSSDGTLSDLGGPTDGIITPASWSEVGSVASELLDTMSLGSRSALVQTSR